MSINVYNIDEFEKVDGIIERVEIIHDRVTVFLEESEREYRIIPAAIEMFSRERIEEELTYGTIVEMKVTPFGNIISIKEIRVGNRTLLSAAEMVERLYEDDRVTRNFGIGLTAGGFTLSLALFLIGFIKHKKEKRIEQREG